MKKMVFKFIILIISACLCSVFVFYHVERAKPAPIIPDILQSQNEFENDFINNTNYTIDNPRIILNPYKISPLSALIIFNTADLTSPTVTILGHDDNSTITNTFLPSKQHILPILGLYPGCENKVNITLNDKIYSFTITTKSLPSDFIVPTNVFANKDILENELYFVTPSSKGYTAAYDVNGEVRWYLSDKFIWDIKRLNNGHLMLGSNRLINKPYYTTGLAEMDLLGKIYYEYNLPGGYHHDMFEMPDGNLLILSNDFSGDTVEDYIVLLDRTNGSIIKKIDLKNILPVNDGKNAYWSSFDWFHNNSIWYDAKTNSITLSGRHQDAVINIDYSTNLLNWIIGDNSHWSKKMQKYFFKPTDNLTWQYAQHAAMILPNSNVFLFDNGNNRSKFSKNYVKPINNYSRGVIYNINTNNKTINQVWEYGKERGSDYYSPYISDVDYLGEEHYLIHSGGHAKTKNTILNNAAGLQTNTTLTSYTTEILNNEVIFEMQLPSNFYRAEKLSLYANDIYTPGIGKRLGNMEKTKANSHNPSILINHDSKKIVKKYNIKVTKEIDRTVITGNFKKSDCVSIILDNIFKNKSYNMIISDKPYKALCVDLNNDSKDKMVKTYKYINDIGLSGKYYVYIKINGKVYDLNKYISVK
ncbi:MAG: aryl-sulfate sulfotransferase [Bacilli bacterium]